MLSKLERSYEDEDEAIEKSKAEHVDCDSGSDDGVADQERRGPYKKRKKLPVSVRLDNEGHCARLTKAKRMRLPVVGEDVVCVKSKSLLNLVSAMHIYVDSAGDSTCFKKFHMEESLA